MVIPVRQIPHGKHADEPDKEEHLAYQGTEHHRGECARTSDLRGEKPWKGQDCAGFHSRRQQSFCAIEGVAEEPTDPKRSTSQLTASPERPFRVCGCCQDRFIVEGSGVMLTSQDLDEVVTSELASLCEKRHRQLVGRRRPRQTEGARTYRFLGVSKEGRDRVFDTERLLSLQESEAHRFSLTAERKDELDSSGPLCQHR